VSDERRRPTDAGRDGAIAEVEQEGVRCAWCLKRLSEVEPMWHRRLVTRERWRAYFHLTDCWAFVCCGCATPEMLRESQGQVPEACTGCGRGIYHAGILASGRGTVCSRACRVTVQRRRYEGRRSE